MDAYFEEGMVPVLIKEFLSSRVVPVDIFIKISDSKFIHLFKRGDELLLDRLKGYQDKQIDVLYVKKEDYGPYVHQHLQIAGILLSRTELEGRKKSAVIGRMTSAVLKELDGMGFSRESFDRARTITQSTIQLVESKLTLKDLIESLVATNDEVAAHSMAVSAVSVMIAGALGWEQDANIEKVALGALLHDIGKKELPPELLSKSRAQMSFEEVQLYESHTYRGMMILQSLGIVPDDILRIVYEHHERGAGQGFPRRMMNARIHPLAKVVGLANEFVGLTVKGPDCPNPKTAIEAVDYIERIMGQPFAKDIFKALRDVVTSSTGKKPRIA